MSQRYISTKVGTIGGTIATALHSTSAYDLIGSAMIAIFGACVSFIVSLLLKIYLKDWLKSRLRRKRKK
jgi:hypothetical protein